MRPILPCWDLKACTLLWLASPILSTSRPKAHFFFYDGENLPELEIWSRGRKTQGIKFLWKVFLSVSKASKVQINCHPCWPKRKNSFDGGGWKETNDSEVFLPGVEFGDDSQPRKIAKCHYLMTLTRWLHSGRANASWQRGRGFKFHLVEGFFSSLLYPILWCIQVPHRFSYKICLAVQLSARQV